MFKDKFPFPNAGQGDHITCVVEGLLCRAWIEPDDDLSPPDKRMDGYWPSLDPKADGFIGLKHGSNTDYAYGVIDRRDRARLRRATARAHKIMDLWTRSEWFYCGVCVNVWLSGYYDALASNSLWGIECNYPSRQKNNYLTEVANEMLPGVLDEAREHPEYLKREFEFKMREAAKPKRRGRNVTLPMEMQSCG
jgi:hypothetical protein